MKTVHIRDVPDDVHHELVRRAENAGQSLQQYLHGELTALVARPPLDDVIAEIEARPKGDFTRESVLATLDEDRARR